MGTERFKPYMEFTAQGKAYEALMVMISQLEKRPHSAAELLPVVVFMAFTVEAYLNSLGARKIEFWDEIERIPWRNKIKVLHLHAGKEADWGSKQLQYAAKLFALRDKLAHGKPEVVAGPICESRQEVEEKLLEMVNPPWLKELSAGWLKTARTDFRELMNYLSGLYGLEAVDHQFHSHGRFEVIRSDHE